MALASSSASSRSRTRQMGSAGPKTSSVAIGESCGGSTTTVGSWNQPWASSGRRAAAAGDDLAAERERARDLVLEQRALAL